MKGRDANNPMPDNDRKPSDACDMTGEGADANPESTVAPGYKPIPAAYDCERSVLGTILDHSDEAHIVVQQIPGPLVFEDVRHRKIYGAILAVIADGGKPDHPTVGMKLFRDLGQECNGLVAYMSGLTGQGLLCLVKQHCDIIRENFLRRRLSHEVWLADERVRKGDSIDGIIAGLTLGIADISESVTASTYDLLSIEEILASPEGIEWCVRGLVPANGVTILSGDSGVGKTWLAIALGLAVAQGEPWLGKFITEQGPVLFIDEESGQDLLRDRLMRLGVSNLANDVPVSTAVYQRVQLDTLDGKAKIIATVKECNARLVIVDSLVRVHTLDENDASEMKTLMTAFTDIARGENCALLVTHHTRKKSPHSNQPSQMLRGSTEIKASVDSHLYAEKAGDRQMRVLHDKSRFGPELPPFIVTIECTQDTVRLAAEDETQTKLAEAMGLIRESLDAATTDEPVLRKELERKCCDEGISGRTFSDALQSLKSDEEIREKRVTVTTGTGKPRSLKAFYLVREQDSGNGGSPQSADSGGGANSKAPPRRQAG